MPSRSHPPRPNLDQLGIQANELQRAHGERQASAAARLIAHHPRMKHLPAEAVLDAPLARADAQLAIAREYGFESWAALEHHVESGEKSRSSAVIRASTRPWPPWTQAAHR